MITQSFSFLNNFFLNAFNYFNYNFIYICQVINTSYLWYTYFFLNLFKIITIENIYKSKISTNKITWLFFSEILMLK